MYSTHAGTRLFACLLSLLAGVACVHRPPLEFRMETTPLQNYDYPFPSGLRLVVQEDHSQSVVAISTLIDHGSGEDPAGKEGTAHLLEHLWFRSRHARLPSVADTYVQLGAVSNAFTRPENTEYVVMGPVSAWTSLLRLEALRLEEPLAGITQADLDLERDIVRNEHLLHDTRWPVEAQNLLFSRLFPEGHAYHRAAASNDASLNAITLEDLQAYARDHYRPSATTIVVVGDLTQTDATEALQHAVPTKLLADPAAPNAPVQLTRALPRVTTASEAPPTPSSTELVRVIGHVEEPALFIAWSLPGAYRADQAAIELAAANMSSIMERSVNWHFTFGVSSYSELNEASCYFVPGRTASSLICRVILGEKQVPEKVLDDALDSNLGARMLDPATLLSERWRTASDLLTHTERLYGPGGRASRIAENAHYTGNTTYIVELLQRLGALRPADITEIAYSYLNRDRAVAVLVEPFSALEVTSAASSSAGRVADGWSRSENDDSTARWTDAVIQDATFSLDMTSLHRSTLPNGLQVVVFANGSLPMARTALVFQGGDWVEPKTGVALFSRIFTRSDYSIAAERLGFWQFSSRNGTHDQFGLLGSAANVPDQLYMIRQHVDRLDIELTFKEKFIDLQKSALLYWSDRPDAAQQRVSLERLVPGHPISNDSDPKHADALRALTEDDLRTWNRDYFQPANATLFVVGNVQPEMVEQEVAKYFGSWSGKGASGKRMPTPGPMPAPPKQQIVILDYPESALTRVALQCQVEPLTATNREVLEGIEAVAGREAWQRLRVHQGLTYDVDATVRSEPGGLSLLTMETSVANGDSVRTLEALLGITGELGTTPADASKLRAAKAWLARSAVLELQSNADVLTELEIPVRFGFDWDFITGRPKRLGQLKGEDIQRAMDRCRGHEVVTLMGPAQVITAQLQAGGRPYEVVKWR